MVVTSRPAFYHVFLPLLCQVFPVEFEIVVAHPFVVVVTAGVESLEIAAVSAVVEPLGIVDVWSSLGIAALPELLV